MMRKETQGMLLGLIGVLCFSLTPPATRAAVIYFDPLLLTLGRAILAAIIAAMILILAKQPLPPRSQIKSILVIASCIVVLFPLLLAIAVQTVPASHTAVMLGILPLATSFAAVIRSGERPSALFWFFSLMGAMTVFVFTLSDSGGEIQAADILLALGVIFAATGYTEGARLSKELGSWQTISWALVFGAPFLMIPFGWMLAQATLVAPPSAWIGFIYVAIVSQLLGFFPWYKGLAIGGTARVSQVMLLMPFMTMIFSSWLLTEHVKLSSWLFAATIVVIVMLSMRLPTHQKFAVDQLK